MTEVDKFYADLIFESDSLHDEALIEYWNYELPYLCSDEYLKLTGESSELLCIDKGSFTYVFDLTRASSRSSSDPSAINEDRLVLVYGRSITNTANRKGDNQRLREWIGPTEKVFGKDWDKGHFMGHSLGGAVSGHEINVFVQRRELNRGWSEQGKKYRSMEKYCTANPNTGLNPLVRHGVNECSVGCCR